MDITVYLPDEIGARAKAADLPFSRLLRSAVADELERVDALARAKGGMTFHKVEVGGATYGERSSILRFTGRPLAGDGDVDVYQTDSGTIVAAWSEGGYETWEDAEDFGAWLDDGTRGNAGQASERVLAEAAEALGLPEVIDL